MIIIIIIIITQFETGKNEPNAPQLSVFLSFEDQKRVRCPCLHIMCTKYFPGAYFFLVEPVGAVQTGFSVAALWRHKAALC